MRAFLCGLLLAVSVGCGVRTKEETPTRPIAEVRASSIPNENISLSTVARLPFGELWTRAAPKRDMEKEMASLAASQKKTRVITESLYLCTELAESILAGADDTYTRHLMLMVAVPPVQIPTQVEAFAKFVGEEVKKTGAKMIDLSPVTEPRSGFSIRYETGIRTGMLAIAVANRGETESQLTAGFPLPIALTPYQHQMMASPGDNSFVILALDEGRR